MAVWCIVRLTYNIRETLLASERFCSYHVSSKPEDIIRPPYFWWIMSAGTVKSWKMNYNFCQHRLAQCNHMVKWTVYLQYYERRPVFINSINTINISGYYSNAGKSCSMDTCIQYPANTLTIKLLDIETNDTVNWFGQFILSQFTATMPTKYDPTWPDGTKVVTPQIPFRCRLAPSEPNVTTDPNCHSNDL